MEMTNMLSPGRIVTWSISAPFERAVLMLRRGLEAEGLHVPCELDTAARLRRELGISLRKSVVLWVDDPLRLLEATVMNPAGALFVPQAVVIVEGSDGSRAAIRSLSAAALIDLPAGLRRAVAELHDRVVAALERAGTKNVDAPVRPECTAIA
jgi:hypothetical protein